MMLDCVRPVILGIRRAQPSVCFWPSWLCGWIRDIRDFV